MPAIRDRIPAVLHDKSFRRFYFGQSISALGGAMSPLAVAFAILAINGSAVDLGLVLGAGTIPALVLTLFGGVAGDRFERRRILVTAELVMAVCQGVLATAIITGIAEVWHFIVVEFVFGCVRAFSSPAMTGFLPSLVPADSIQPANALLRIARNVVQIIGPAGAGIVVATLSPGWALALDALSFLISALMLAGLPKSFGVVEVGTSVWASLVTGWREFRSRTWVWSMVTSFAVYQATVLPAMYVLGPVLAEDHYSGATFWAFVLSARAAGALLMGFVLLAWRPARPLVASTAAILLDIPFLVALGTGAPAPLVVIAGTVSSAGLMAADTLWESTLQSKVPPEIVSRVSSYDWMGSIVFSPLGFLLVGVVAAAYGATTILLVVTAVHLLVRLTLLATRPIRLVRR
jgi:MFS family permease